MRAPRLLLYGLVALLPLGANAQLGDLLTPLTPADEVESKGQRRTQKKRVKSPSRKKAAEDSQVITLVPLVSSAGEVRVKVMGPTAGAVVLLNGREIEAGRAVEQEPGEYIVAVRRPGWADFTRAIRVLPGETVEVAALMEPVAGVLTVAADIPGAQVFVDGQRVGEVPVSGHLLPPGMREVVVRKEGFEDHLSRLSIRAGRDYTVRSNLRPAQGSTRADRPGSLRLVPQVQDGTGIPWSTDQSEPEPGWYQRWYVWAGVGAAAVAVTSAILVSNGSGARSLSPSDVCRGDCDAVLNPPSFRF